MSLFSRVPAFGCSLPTSPTRLGGLSTVESLTGIGLQGPKEVDRLSELSHPEIILQFSHRLNAQAPVSHPLYPPVEENDPMMMEEEEDEEEIWAAGEAARMEMGSTWEEITADFEGVERLKAASETKDGGRADLKSLLGQILPPQPKKKPSIHREQDASHPSDQEDKKAK